VLLFSKIPVAVGFYQCSVLCLVVGNLYVIVLKSINYSSVFVQWVPEMLGGSCVMVRSQAESALTICM